MPCVHRPESSAGCAAARARARARGVQAAGREAGAGGCRGRRRRGRCARRRSTAAVWGNMASPRSCPVRGRSVVLRSVSSARARRRCGSLVSSRAGNRTHSRRAAHRHRVAADAARPAGTATDARALRVVTSLAAGRYALGRRRSSGASTRLARERRQRRRARAGAELTVDAREAATREAERARQAPPAGVRRVSRGAGRPARRARGGGRPRRPGGGASRRCSSRASRPPAA